MQPNNHAVDRARINRRVYYSPLTAWMMGPGSLALGMVAAVVGGLVYPVSLWLSFPVLMFWAPALLFADWQMPMRMPMDMERLDPSTQRQVPGKLWGFLPIAVARTTMDKAAGILYMGYLRGQDAGRELWLNMDDMCRHLLMFGTTGAGKTEALLGYVLCQLGFGKGLIYSDAKAQNDVPTAIASLARYYGREDDVRHAEIAGEYLRKGSQVYIEGKLQTREWEKDGIKRYTTEIIVDMQGTLQLLGSRPQGDQAQRPATGGYQHSAPRSQPQRESRPAPQPMPQSSPDDFPDDDIPFMDPYRFSWWLV